MIREKNDLIKERKDFMEREIENNKELERNIGTTERQALRLRQQLQDEERNHRRLQDEVSPNTGASHFLKYVSSFHCSSVLKSDLETDQSPP